MRPTPHHTIKYSSCTLPELRHFAKSRNLTVTTARSKRLGATEQDYIKALEQDDLCPASPFRFLDLPPELKSRVYSASLDNGDISTACPNILGVCRQIHDEACGIPFSANEFKLVVVGSTVQIGGLKYGISTAQHPEAVMEIQWPDVLRKVENMTLAFAYPRPGPATYIWLTSSIPPDSACRHRHVLLASRANHALFSLCSFLSRGNRPKKITIDLDTLLQLTVTSEPFDSCSCVQAVFQPLRLLGSVTGDKIVIERTEADTLVQAVKKLWGEPVWTHAIHNTLPDSFKIIKEARAAVEYDFAANASPQEKNSGSEPRRYFLLYFRADDKLANITKRLDEIQSLFGHAKFIDRAIEQSLSSMLDGLRRQLDQVSVEGLQKAISKSVESKRRRIAKMLEERRGNGRRRGRVG